MTRRIAELRLPEVGAISDTSIIIQPVGSIEQHGPHLPFNTDLIIAERVGEALIERYGDELDLWLLPSLAYSRSGEHAWASGTIWLSTETFLSVVGEVACSLSGLAAKKLVFLNGHGGNSSLLNVACRDIRRRHGFQTFLMHPMIPPDQGGESAPSELGMGVHGGHLETSLMMHLAPELVADTMPEAVIPLELAELDHVQFGGPVTFGWLSSDFTAEGHIGDPTGATAEIGHDVFESTIRYLEHGLEEISNFSF